MPIAWKIGPTSATAVEIAPTWGTKIPKKQIRSDTRTRAGKLFFRKWVNYKTFELPVSYVPSSVATIINSWWSTGTEVFLFVESGGGVDVHSCMILNTTEPLAGFNRPYDDLYTGIIKLEEHTPA